MSLAIEARLLFMCILLGMLPIVAAQTPEPGDLARKRELGELHARISGLESRLAKAEQDARSQQSVSLALLGIAGLCALWAQNSGRNPWLWFALGFIFNVIAVLVMLRKNSVDRDSLKRMAEGTERDRRHELLRRTVAGEPDPIRYR